MKHAEKMKAVYSKFLRSLGSMGSGSSSMLDGVRDMENTLEDILCDMEGSGQEDMPAGCSSQGNR